MTTLHLYPYVNNCCSPEIEFSNVKYWETKFDLKIVWTEPKKAKGILVGGWIQDHNRLEIIKAYESLKNPKYVFAFGACAISSSTWMGGDRKNFALADILPVTTFIGGCSPHPDQLWKAIHSVIHPDKERGSYLDAVEHPGIA
jgi:Ni,Fe-hydrogenase III small subunit